MDPQDSPNGPLKILGVFAHPHDFTHVAGTCAHHIQAGDSVTMVIVSDGGSTHNELLAEELQKPPDQRDPQIVKETREEYVRRKTEELKKACAVFGITDVRVLPHQDKPIKRSDQIVEHLADLFCEIRPDILITQRPAHLIHSRHLPERVPDDHCTCAEIVTEALTLAEVAKHDRDRVPFKLAQLYFTAVDCAYTDVQLFVDITDQYEKRIEAEKFFGSQSQNVEGYCEKRITISVGPYGWYAGVAYAEPFIRAFAEVDNRLTVTGHGLGRARESNLERMARVGSK